MRDRPSPPAATLTASLLPLPDTGFRFARNGEGGFALSPDGTLLAFVGRTEGKAQLWLRSLGESGSRLLPDSEGAYNPFWSPDSRWVAFFTPQKLKKMEVATGAVVDVHDMPGLNLMGSWSSRGFMIWGTPGFNVKGHITTMPNTGGSAVPIPGTEGASNPQFLPDGRGFIFLRGGIGFERHVLWLASLDPDVRAHSLGEAGTWATYSEGYILSAVKGILMAQPFDLARGEFSGEPFALKAPMASRLTFGILFTNFSANIQGMQVYPPKTNSLTELRWRDRNGKHLGSLGAPGEYYSPRISPDGRRVAFSRREADNSDVWVANLNTNAFTRLTFDPAIDENPVWSADGSLTFANNASGIANLYRKAATGAGSVARLTTSTFEEQPLDWSRDGRFLVYSEISSPSEILIQAASGGQPVRFLGHHAHGAVHAQFNPGVPRWIAYDFDDSGRREVYVQAFEPGKPASSARWQISNAGGQMPRWRGDGKEIFYLTLDGKMMAARVSNDGTAFQSSTPQFLFNATPPQLRPPNFEYDVFAGWRALFDD